MSKISKVLSHPPPDSGPYIERWAQGLRMSGVVVEELTIRNLLGSTEAAVHIHWPEHLVRPGRPHAVLLRFARTLLIFAMLVVQRNPVVWTAHNLSPHSGWRRVDRAVVGVFHRVLKGVIVTTAAHIELIKREFPRLESKSFNQVPLVALEPGSVGHRPFERRSGPTRLLQFGTIAPYRGQELVVKALHEQLESGDCELSIVGRFHDATYLEGLEATAATLPGLTLRAGHLPDDELRRFMLDADVVIGVQVDGLNTGVLPAALPLGVPVISADTLQAKEIRGNVGGEWVFVLQDLEDSACWRQAVEWALAERQPIAKDIFDVEENGRMHLRFYEELSGAR